MRGRRVRLGAWRPLRASRRRVKRHNRYAFTTLSTNSFTLSSFYFDPLAQRTRGKSKSANLNNSPSESVTLPALLLEMRCLQPLYPSAFPFPIHLVHSISRYLFPNPYINVSEPGRCIQLIAASIYHSKGSVMSCQVRNRSYFSSISITRLIQLSEASRFFLSFTQTNLLTLLDLKHFAQPLSLHSYLGSVSGA